VIIAVINAVTIPGDRRSPVIYVARPPDAGDKRGDDHWSPVIHVVINVLTSSGARRSPVISVVTQKRDQRNNHNNTTIKITLAL
jgi:hypothetical protein